MVELSLQLNQFQQNPFFTFFTGQLQAMSDDAVQSIVSGFIQRDEVAVLEREQVIGAAPAFLKFGQLVLSTDADLKQAIQLQLENEH